MWNWLVSVLALGAAIVLYDGSPLMPTPYAMWDLIDEIGKQSNTTNTGLGYLEIEIWDFTLKYMFRKIAFSNKLIHNSERLVLKFFKK